MTKLKQLIQIYCPYGVEKRTIDSLCDICRGRVISKDYINENKGDYPVYSSQTENNGELGKISTFDFNGEYLSWTTDGANAGTIFYRNGKFSITNVCGLLKVKEPDLLAKYLYYALSVEAPRYVNKGMGNPKLMSNVMSVIQIQVPPLPVQEEIVRILDKFTELEAELAQELAQELAHRKQQYAFYRDRLLSFESPIVIKTLEELGVFYGGLTGKTKDDFSDGNAKFITYMNVFKNSELDQNANDKVKIDKNEKQHKIQFGDVLFTGSSETRDECGMSSVVTHEPTEDMYLNSFCFGYRLNDTAMFNPHFLKHLFRSDMLRKQIIKTANGVTRFNVSKEKMKQIKIPVPPMNVQNRLAYVLDNFDAICSDLSIGLPAEIAAREKQYNYYRDLLFNYAADIAGFKQSRAEQSRAEQSRAEQSKN